ncbi:MAG TPA: adenylate/guanylate cyclase domain-containing protein [Gaiellaceae bacterium]|nr:adenylate/guanylate cyclase domain-containing protein [Gaiellaceae bacterium]
MERKLATVLFADLVESTQLVSGSDPEVVRRRVTRFFEQVSHCIETHGGTVEKFAGDAVMAAFGIPRAHEDDAERAIRAALGIMESVDELGVEVRIGVEAGEVVADDSDSTFATGEAVNIAARLQQTAKPGQILIGPGAYRLTVGRAVTEDVGPLELRGRETPLWAWRVVSAVDGAPHSRVEAPLVGRLAELELLENTYARSVRDRRAHLFTIYGDPGVGKSRLAREFVSTLEGTSVFAGRCLPYGEGITYWPLAEMVKAAAGIADDDPIDEALEKLRATCEIEAVADLLGLASGILAAVEGERSRQELAWAARAWAQQLAEAQPLVLVFEDIHWAEDPLLDLVEHLAAWVRDVPVLLLCLARPELLDVRPGWGGGRVRATAIELEPLGLAESEELADALLAEHHLPEEMRDLVLEKTEGNPLFVEETVRMLVEEDGRAVELIPDTLQALIAARIDRLPQPQKTLLQRASVMGRIFWPGAVARLAPDLDDLDPLLEDLLLREFVLEESRSTITGERAYRFKHVLIREVAYATLSKSMRAELHEAFAGWLAERAGEELLEIRAYHLEQACTIHFELEGSCPPELADAAASALEAAGRRALARESFHTARRVLCKAVELEPTLERRYLAARAAWKLADFPAVAVEMEEVRAAAVEAGDRRLSGRAWTALAEVALHQAADAARARELADHALDAMTDEPDVDAQFEALTTRGNVASWLGEDPLPYSEQGLALATVAGRKDLETLAAQALANIYTFDLELERAQQFISRALELADESGSLFARASALSSAGSLHLILEELEEAEAAYSEARRLVDELGVAQAVGYTTMMLGRIVERRGDDSGAERLLRESIRVLQGLGDRSVLCEAQRRLAQLLVKSGRLDEAERLALKARETVGREDATSLVTTAMALGIVRAAQGRDDEAEGLLRKAVEDARPFKLLQIEPLKNLAQFLRERGRTEEAAPFEARWAELSPAEAKMAARIA